MTSFLIGIHLYINKATQSTEIHDLQPSMSIRYDIAPAFSMLPFHTVYEDRYHMAGYHRARYSRAGYDSAGYDEEGYSRAGYDSAGYNRCGYNRDGYNRCGYDRRGYDEYGYDKEGYNRYGYDKRGYNIIGRDEEGYDESGYGIPGRDRTGYNRAGYDIAGYNRQGHIQGCNEQGPPRADNTEIELKCKVCMTNRIRIACHPCLHMCLCIPCSKKIETICPICKQPTQRLITIFL
ncbi:MAG TPA: RING-HC finger protein [Nitrospiraceae bacterium]|nr:RING-HC finger protein [Nitrospiraceae bacterium]